MQELIILETQPSVRFGYNQPTDEKFTREKDIGTHTYIYTHAYSLTLPLPKPHFLRKPD